MKKIIISAIIILGSIIPTTQAHAIDAVIRSAAAIVTDTATGRVIYSKESSTMRAPASLTKLVTALVLFDYKPDMDRVISVIKADEVGGGRFRSKPTSKYYCKDLIAASLMASTNNTTNAIVRCTDLSRDEFIAQMNMKVRELGGIKSTFFEPTGMNPANQITAEEYALVLNAAMANKDIQKYMQTKTYSFAAVNNKKIKHTMHNTDVLLKDADLMVNAGKTGFIYESMYNFATVLTNPLGKQVSVVVLGAPTRKTSFAEAKKLGLEALFESAFLGVN